MIENSNFEEILKTEKNISECNKTSRKRRRDFYCTFVKRIARKKCFRLFTFLLKNIT